MDIPLRREPSSTSKKMQIHVRADLLVRMRLRPSVNWSEVCRRAIRTTLDELEASEKKQVRRQKSLADRKAAGKPAPFTDLWKRMDKRRKKLKAAALEKGDR